MESFNCEECGALIVKRPGGTGYAKWCDHYPIIKRKKPAKIEDVSKSINHSRIAREQKEREAKTGRFAE